jgi:Histidine kinase-, DNA gyrase B-, and HSP90-like ATPase
MPLHGGEDSTLPMGIANIGFMLDRLGRDCDDLQFLREITENALQAGATTIVWDVDWKTWELSGGTLYKLCCIDNGSGMTGEEMLEYINQLSSSTHEQTFDGNYGVGAKVAAATRNPAGLIYQSWKHGRGNMIQLWRDAITNQYGLRQFEVGGHFGYWQPLRDEAKPKEVQDHGTKVILLGVSEEHNTIEPPAGVQVPTRQGG